MPNLKAVFPEEEVLYGDLHAGETSMYTEVKKAYRYTYLMTIIKDRKVILQPVDFAGEQPLESGRYTYVLMVDEEKFESGEKQARYALKLELRKD